MASSFPPLQDIVATAFLPHRRDADAAGGGTRLSAWSPSPERWTRRCSIEPRIRKPDPSPPTSLAEAERSTVTAEQSVAGRPHDCGDGGHYGCIVWHDETHGRWQCLQNRQFLHRVHRRCASERVAQQSGIIYDPPVAVPEPSTWAMMLLGFAGLGYASYRSTRRTARRHGESQKRVPSSLRLVIEVATFANRGITSL